MPRPKVEGSVFRIQSRTYKASRRNNHGREENADTAKKANGWRTGQIDSLCYVEQRQGGQLTYGTPIKRFRPILDLSSGRRLVSSPIFPKHFLGYHASTFQEENSTSRKCNTIPQREHRPFLCMRTLVI